MRSCRDTTRHTREREITEGEGHRERERERLAPVVFCDAMRVVGSRLPAADNVAQLAGPLERKRAIVSCVALAGDRAPPRHTLRLSLQVLSASILYIGRQIGAKTRTDVDLPPPYLKLCFVTHVTGLFPLSRD